MRKRKKVRNNGFYSFLLLDCDASQSFNHSIIQFGYSLVLTEYSSNDTLIPKNTSLTIARVPLTAHKKKQWDPLAEKQAAARAAVKNDAPTVNTDLSAMTGTEEDKIDEMMKQSTMDYDPHK